MNDGSDRPMIVPPTTERALTPAGGAHLTVAATGGAAAMPVATGPASPPPPHAERSPASAKAGRIGPTATRQRHAGATICLVIWFSVEGACSDRDKDANPAQTQTSVRSVATRRPNACG